MPATPPSFDSILASIQHFGQQNGAVTTQARSNVLSTGVGGGGSVGGPVGDPGNKGGLTLSLPGGTTVGGGDSSSGAGATSSTAGVSLGQIGSLIACFVSPTTCLLRLVMLILGIICVIGAIYLYKPTQQIVAAPARAVRDAAVATTE